MSIYDVHPTHDTHTGNRPPTSPTPKAYFGAAPRREEPHRSTWSETMPKRSHLRAELNHRGSSLKIVHVRGAVESTTDDEILAVAYVAAGETRSSLFGHSIDRTLDVIVVSLWTD